MNPVNFLKHSPSPSDTRFIGRDAELETIRHSLQTSRLVTLVGSGGCGKTRLALEAAAHLSDVYLGHVWLVDLAQLSNPSLLPGAVARAAGVRQEMDHPIEDALIHATQLQYGLLVLDNCDHLAEASTRLIDLLLHALPDLKVLATCRKPLVMHGQLVLQVPPLKLPPPNESNPRLLMISEAVRLFKERAHLVAPSFVLTDANIHAVADICRHLDGLPLPIELVVAHVNFLTVEQIAVRLHDEIIELAGGRTGSRSSLLHHQTVQAAIEWSYLRLPSAEQMLLRQLAVFSGGWTPDAAQAICTQSDEAVPAGEIKKLLKRLVERALIREDALDGSHFSMLWPVREYALKRLEESGDVEKTRTRHLEYYLGIAEKAEQHLLYKDYRPWLDSLISEFSNLQVAFDWALQSGRNETGLFLASILQHLWIRHGFFNEGATWLERALSGSADKPSLARVRALYVLGRLERFTGQYEKARLHLEECVRQAQAADDESSLAEGLTLLGRVEMHDGQFSKAYNLVNQAISIQRRLEDQTGIVLSLGVLGAISQAQAEYDDADRYYDEAISLARRTGNQWRTAILLLAQGYVARRRGRLSQAQALLREALTLSLANQDPWTSASCLMGLGGLAVDTGDLERSAILFGAAEKASETLGSHLDFAQNLEYQRDLDALRNGIDHALLFAAWAGGRAMHEEQAVRYALSGPELAAKTTQTWIAK